jgi:hypothetical protein
MPEQKQHAPWESVSPWDAFDLRTPGPKAITVQERWREGAQDTAFPHSQEAKEPWITQGEWEERCTRPVPWAGLIRIMR